MNQSNEKNKSNVEKLRYAVLTKRKGIKKYIDKRWCYCASYNGPHIHIKGA